MLRCLIKTKHGSSVTQKPEQLRPLLVCYYGATKSRIDGTLALWLGGGFRCRLTALKGHEFLDINRPKVAAVDCADSHGVVFWVEQIGSMRWARHQCFESIFYRRRVGQV